MVKFDIRKLLSYDASFNRTNIPKMLCMMSDLMVDTHGWVLKSTQLDCDVPNYNVGGHATFGKKI